MYIHFEGDLILSPNTTYYLRATIYIIYINIIHIVHNYVLLTQYLLYYLAF